MRKRFVHLGINPLGSNAINPGSTAPVKYAEILQSFFGNRGIDWYRYASQNWVLWTDADLTELSMSIQGLPGFKEVYVLATEVGGTTPLTLQGLMPQVFWNWIYKPRV